jgi:hypothetical protein
MNSMDTQPTQKAGGMEQVNLSLPKSVVAECRTVAAQEGISLAAALRRPILQWARQHAPARLQENAR